MSRVSSGTSTKHRQSRPPSMTRCMSCHGNLDGKTFLEEEQDRQYRDQREEDIRWCMWWNVLEWPKQGWSGHLREVSKAGFITAVECKAHGVWMVIYLYELIGVIACSGGKWLIHALCSRWTGVIHWKICHQDLHGCILR